MSQRTPSKNTTFAPALIMRGLGALGVIVGHAVQEVFDREELWLTQHSLSSFGSHLGTPEHHLLFALRQLALFAVPMFVFVSGFVRAYGVAQGKPVQWKSIRRWIGALIPPFIIGLLTIWAAYFGPVLLTRSRAIRLEEVLGTYDFVAFIPIAIEFYCLFPFIVRIAKRSPVALLIGAAVIQSSVIAAWYLSHSTLPFAAALGQYASFSEYHFWSRMMYFCGGVVIGLYHAKLLPQLAQRRGWLVGLVMLFGALSVLEMERTSPTGTLLASQFLAPAVAYFICLSLLVASWGQAWRGQRIWLTVGQRSLGIYILQWAVLFTLGRVSAALFPQLMFQPLLFLVILCSVALIAPLLVSYTLGRAKLERPHRYIFGSGIESGTRAKMAVSENSPKAQKQVTQAD
jgi:peptidoglycan/LPS O-acetylase OafA/YrhL